jgi:hypothetical protein
MIPEAKRIVDCATLFRRGGNSAFFFVFCLVSRAQTTQGLIQGRVIDLRTAAPVPNCRVQATPRSGGAEMVRSTRPDGSYILAPLSPGAYDLTFDCAQYQRLESHNVRLEVASLLLINTRVRVLSEVWEDNYRRLLLLPDSNLLTLYGPDVDVSHSVEAQPLRSSPAALEATVSQVIASDALTDLPLSGRNAYTLLILQPGSTSDSGTSRSLALSVNGQRPSASSFLLDGVENDNPLITGPLSPIAPEALSEYRISSNSFSAEYGRASGFVANAITRAGTADYHGVGYFNLRNEVFSARAQRVPGGDPSAPFREIQPGGVLTGPIIRRKLLGSLSWEITRLYTRQPAQDFTVPTRRWIQSLDKSSLASRWLSPFALNAPDVPGDTYTYGFAPPLHINRQTVVPRIDWSNSGGTQHLYVRYAGFFVSRPEFDYSPYPGFTQEISDRTHSIAGSWTALPRPHLANELRFGFSLDTFSALSPQPNAPLLTVVATANTPLGVNLPSPPTSVTFLNRTRTIEVDENVTYTARQHVIRWGAGWVPRGISGVLGKNAIPRFDFNNLSDFANDAPSSLIVAVPRSNPLTSGLPDLNRQYSIGDWYGFAQDSYRPFQRLTLNAGLRYDWFGSPEVRGTEPDFVVEMPASGDVAARVAAAALVLAPPGTHLYDIRHNGLAFRGGVSYALDRNSTTVLRAAFGTYTDRPFDNLWQTIRNNDTSLVQASLTPIKRDYSNTAGLLATLPPQAVVPNPNDLSTFATGFSTPRVRSWLAGIQHSLTERFLIEGDYLGSASVSLVTTDRWNRSYSVPSVSGNAAGRYTPALPDIIYRGNQGRSSYAAAAALMRYRGTRFTATLSYTFSRTDDTQSDPISGEEFDLGFGGGAPGPQATFIRQGDPSADWGHAAFDRRHDFVVAASWMLPGPFAGFRFSMLGAARSGSPFTVIGVPAAVSSLLDNPADILPGARVWAGGYPAGAGVQLLNPSAFVAVADHVGNSGRNQLYGPGLVSADASLSRRFHIPRSPERVQAVVRFDVYNVFNHANLGNPENNLSSPDFGIATRASQPTPQAFGIFAPLGDSRRQAQVMLKLEF